MGQWLRRSQVRLAGGMLMLACSAGGAATAPAPQATRAVAREIFAHLVALDTSPGHGNLPRATAYLAEQFRQGGFPAADVRVFPLGDLSSLVVRYRGAGTAARPIAFLAHLDVIGANRADWVRDPFLLTEEDGFFFGRGTLDMKQEIALMSATFLRLKAEHYVPQRDLILAYTGDEETAELTTEDLLANHRDAVDAEYAINADGVGGGVLSEDTARPLVTYLQGAEKSSERYTLTTRNAGGHSSQPRADNAIYELADALKAIQRYEFPLRWNEWTLGDFRAAGPVTPGPLGAAMVRFAADPHDVAAAATIAQEPVYVGRLRTTCVATMLAGGHAENALPQSASATVNCRIFPGTPPAEVQQTLASLVGPRVEIVAGNEAIASDPSPLRADVVQAVGHAVDAANPGARVVPTQVSFATDSAPFRNAGIPAYGIGSVFSKSSETFAHGLDERVRVDQFYRGLTHWYVLMRELAAQP